MKSKNVVLFGNANSVFEEKRKIDSKYDLVCRINAGSPKGKEEFLGSRTDILFLSLGLSEQIIKEMNPDKIFWCTPKEELMTDYIKKSYDLFSRETWTKLYKKLGKTRPSTGLMAIEYFVEEGFKTLTLIGFDFWKTKNWYTNTRHIGPHNPEKERNYVIGLIADSGGKIRKE